LLEQRPPTSRGLGVTPLSTYKTPKPPRQATAMDGPEIAEHDALAKRANRKDQDTSTATSDNSRLAMKA
jgi:hypothetical protein